MAAILYQQYIRLKKGVYVFLGTVWEKYSGEMSDIHSVVPIGSPILPVMSQLMGSNDLSYSDIEATIGSRNKSTLSKQSKKIVNDQINRNEAVIFKWRSTMATHSVNYDHKRDESTIIYYTNFSETIIYGGGRLYLYAKSKTLTRTAFSKRCRYFVGIRFYKLTEDRIPRLDYLVFQDNSKVRIQKIMALEIGDDYLVQNIEIDNFDIYRNLLIKVKVTFESSDLLE